MRRLALLSLLALAGCGSGGDETALLGPVEASRLDRQVELVDERVAAGDCDGARQALARYADLVGQLPERRDADLRRALRDGATQLEGTIGADCEEAEAPEPTTTLETEPEPTETETEPEPTTTGTEPEPTPTVTEPEPTTTTTTPAEPAPDTGEGDEGGAGDEASGSSGSGGGNSGSGSDGEGGSDSDDSGGAEAPED